MRIENFLEGIWLGEREKGKRGGGAWVFSPKNGDKARGRK